MRLRFDDLATGALVFAALAIATVAVRREFLSVPRPDRAPAPVYLEGWEDWVGDGILVGSPDAPVTIVEFADLQCPFCARFHDAFAKAKAEWGDRISLRFFHYPLPTHSHAEPAAIAAECAADQGRFEPFMNVVYEKQDSMGEKPWVSYAADAGVPDRDAFERCASQPVGSRPRIGRGRDLAERIGATGTPTVIINGWWQKRLPYDSLSSLIRQFLDREPQ